MWHTWDQWEATQSWEGMGGFWKCFICLFVSFFVFNKGWFGLPLCFFSPLLTFFLHGQWMPCPHFDYKYESHKLGMEEPKIESGSLESLTCSQDLLWTSNFQITCYIRKINSYLEESPWLGDSVTCNMQSLAFLSYSACFMLVIYIIFLIFFCSDVSCLELGFSSLWQHSFPASYFQIPWSCAHLLLTLIYFLINLLCVQPSETVPGV